MDDVTVWLEDELDDLGPFPPGSAEWTQERVGQWLDGDYDRVQIHAPRRMGKSRFYAESEAIDTMWDGLPSPDETGGMTLAELLPDREDTA